MVYLQIFVIIFSLCSIQLSNTYLAQIIITLFNFLSFLLPFRTISKSGSIVYLFSFNRLLATFVTFIVDFATVFTRLLNVLTSLNKNRAPGSSGTLYKKGYEILSHNTILPHYKREFRESFKKRLCFFLSVLPSPSTPIF